MALITGQMQQLSLDPELVQASESTTPHCSWESRLDDVQPHRRFYRRRNLNPAQVNPRPLPTPKECRAARKHCGMYYGFYGGELAIQKMIIKCFPEELEGRNPICPNLFLAALRFVRDVTNRPDIGVHIARVSQRNKDAIPSIGLDVGAPTYVIGLFPLEKEAYMNRITQENVDMLAEFFGTKPSWWEVADLTSL